MPIWDAETIQRHADNGEDDFNTEYPCIVDRISIQIFSGTSEYQLSDVTASIRRVTYKGMKLDPLPQRNLRDVFQSATQQGRPFWYIFNNVGLTKIKLFPCPGENIAKLTGDLYGADIPNGVIIEYWRIADHSIYTLPTYIKRRALKAFVLKNCFQMDGPGNNMKAAKYFTQKWDGLKAMYGDLLSELNSKPRKLVLSAIQSSNFFPASPVLPIARFGTGVNEGE